MENEVASTNLESVSKGRKKMKKTRYEPKVQIRNSEEMPKKERKKISSPPYGSSVSGAMKTPMKKKSKIPKRTQVK
jgi:hypothetical protein